MRKESGFTLIELVVVIVILGILAAFAVPRFVGMQDEARTSTLKGLSGSIKGAASLAHGKLLANQTSPESSNYNIDIQGQQVEFVANSTWPAATSDGIDDMLQDTTGFVSTTTNCQGNSTGNCITYSPEGTSSNSTCYTTYEIGAGDDAPSYATNSSDCS